VAACGAYAGYYAYGPNELPLKRGILFNLTNHKECPHHVTQQTPVTVVNCQRVDVVIPLRRADCKLSSNQIKNVIRV